MEMNHEPHQRPPQDGSLGGILIRRVRVVVSPDHYSGSEQEEVEPASASTSESPDEYVHVYATADLVVCGTGQAIASPGTWRVRADDREEILAEAHEAYDELVHVLSALGVALDRPFESLPWDEHLG
jgi:hypothetical protein